jgi:ADP-ribose pyrophosphatase YjhB (NUDIX family)
MKLSTDVNEVQSHIMLRLYANDALRFSEINNQGLPSDQFSYHLRQLIKYGLVEKTPDNLYKLSVTGRSRAIMLDSRSSKFIEQGFVACRVILARQQDDHRQYLMQKRTRVPYLGHIAEPGGKVLFGEDVLQAAQRNMLIETGLRCDMTLRGITHFKDSYQGEIVQDKFFFVVYATNPISTLQPQGPTGENMWMTLEEITNNPKVHEGVIAMIQMAETKSLQFLEEEHYTDEY